MNNQFTHPKERIRFAILTFFFAQGLCMASWASRIPDFKDVFAANYAFYWGLILFMIPVGKFVAIPLAGYLVSKLGSRSMVQVSILGYASSLLCVGLVHEVYLLGFLLFCFGVCWNLCDISFNTQGIEVERIYGKTIMATFHGGWSLGACAGALIGFVMILAGVSPIWHYTLIFIIILIIALSGRKYLQESASQETEVSDTKTQERNAAKAPNGFRLLFQKPEMLLLQLGLVGLFALIVESAMFDWSAVYFESVVHVPKSLQIGFLVFMIMMATGRFLTNYAYQLWGKKKVLQLAGSFICIGFFCFCPVRRSFRIYGHESNYQFFGFHAGRLGYFLHCAYFVQLRGSQIKNTGQYCTYHSVKHQFYRFVDCSPAYRCHLAGVRYPYRLYAYRHIGRMHRINCQFQ